MYIWVYLFTTIVFEQCSQKDLKIPSFQFQDNKFAI